MRTIFLLLLSMCFLVNVSTAQSADDAAVKAVSERDELFWTGYNTCNYERMSEYIADDVEFYHDKGGITLGKIALVESIRKNLCSNPNFRTRREAASESVKVYLLKNSNATYGAIISGAHYFFNSYDNKPEKREGIAKFTSLWILKDGVWKMSRVLSFDHGPAPFENKRQAIGLSEKSLRRFSGQYVGARTGNAVVAVEKGVLTLTAGNGRFTLFPETANLFFVKDRDLTFEFTSENGKVTGLIIRENGEPVEEARIKK